MVSKKQFLIPLIAVFLSSFLLLTSLEDKMFDMFLRAIPSLKENPSVLLIRIDDTSLENVGLFPWPRDILADATVFLKEMGAETVSFDLSYLDNSPYSVNRALIEDDLPQQLNRGFDELDATLDQVMDGFYQSWIAPEEAPDYKEYMLATSREFRQSLQTSLSSITRDVDEYFGDTLAFFDSSFLTLTMVTPEDIGENQTFDMSAYDLDWLEENVALKNIEVTEDEMIPRALGIIPTIPALLEKAAGAGFVNAQVDKDGYRRRLDLLMEYDGSYYGQFIFVPLLKKLGDPKVHVNNRYIILNGARLDGETMDIRIPRSQDGSILIQWPKQQFIDYRDITAWDLIVAGRIESMLIKNLRTMEDSGFFNNWDHPSTPLDLYSRAEYIRRSLTGGSSGEEGVSIESYREYRNAYIDSVDSFLNGPYEKAILDSLDSSDVKLNEYVRGFYEESRRQFSDLQKVRSRVAEAVEGSFCIFGVDATSMTDTGMNTFQERYPNVGIHATLSHMVLSGDFLDDAPPLVSLIIALAFSLLLPILMRHMDTGRSIVAGMVALVLAFSASLLFFILTRRYVGTVVPLSSMTMTFVSLVVLTYLKTSKERSFLHSAFSRYLSPDVITEIVDDPSKLTLGGEKREMSAIFTDLRGFSSISENLDPEDLVRLINLYLSTMSDIVMDEKGTIDKYEGDAIIAFFGAPISMVDHALRACRTALKMKKAEGEINRRIIEDEKLTDQPLFTRIGVNSGEMVVGNMGTASKMDYTIMGNSVNLASRLEGVNKEYRTGGILISQFTREQVGGEFLLRSLDKVRVMGLKNAVRIYELLDFAEGSSPEVRGYLELWEKAMEKYESLDFAGARLGFESLNRKNPDDCVSEVFLNRCDQYLENPPPDDWDGVFSMNSK